MRQGQPETGNTKVPELKRRLWETADMETTQVRLWDPAEHLETEQDKVAYLNAALEEGEPRLTIAALEDMARAKGRENLYKLLSVNDNPEFATVLKVVRALGLRLQATAASPDRRV